MGKLDCLLHGDPWLNLVYSPCSAVHIVQSKIQVSNPSKIHDGMPIKGEGLAVCKWKEMDALVGRGVALTWSNEGLIVL